MYCIDYVLSEDEAIEFHAKHKCKKGNILFDIRNQCTYSIEN